MNNFYTRFALLSIVGFILVAGLSNSLLPEMLRSAQQEVADNLAAEANKLTATKKMNGTPPEYIIQKINEHNLAWYYLTNAKGTPTPATKPFTPKLQTYEEVSSLIEWGGRQYFEAVAAVSKDRNLHVGFYSGPAFGLPGNPLLAQIPFVAAWGLIGVIMLMAGILHYFSVVLPARRIISYFEKKDSGIVGLKPPNPSMAVSEISILKRLLDSKDKILDDKAASLRERESTLRSLNLQYERDMETAKKEKTVLFLKEAEGQFIDKLVNEIDSKANVRDIADTLLYGLNGEFPNSVEFALFFSANPKDEHVLVSHIGFSSNPTEVYKGLSVTRELPEAQSEQECSIIDVSFVRQQHFREICELTSAKQVIVCPLTHLQRRLATLVIFFRGQGQSLEHIIRVLNKAAAVTAKTLFHIAVYEEYIEAARTDQLTGYRNKNYLSHLLPQILEAGDVPVSERVFSSFLIEGHDVISINEKYGRLAGDAMIQELGRRIEKLLQQRRNETLGGWGDYLLRYQGAQFLVILHGVDSKKAVIFAQRLRQLLDSQEWPCGIAKWSTSIGISTFPEDTKNPEEILVNVETALSYARGQSERNKIAHISQVPKAFRSAKLAANLGGSLDVFDPAALLQSLSLSRKSGVLTVTHPDGKQFWCFLENGRPTKARLGKFGGTAALIEFLVLFESGEFSFTDYQSIDQQQLDDIRKLDKRFDFTGSLERALMDGALAHDHYKSAKEVVKQIELYVWPQPGAKNADFLAELRERDEPPTPDEEKAMKEIVRLANGRVQVKHIFDRLDNLQTHVLWRATAILLQNDYIQLKKLATGIGV